MAEYGIVVGFKDIKGNCVLADYKDYILCEAVSFASSSMRMGKGIKNTRISVEQSPVSLQIAAGKWVAELQNACYISKNVGEVKIVQLGQAVDKESQAKPTVLQSLTLSDTVVSSIDQSWVVDDMPRVVGMTLTFSKILLEIDKKPADFTLRNFTAKAV